MTVMIGAQAASGHRVLGSQSGARMHSSAFTVKKGTQMKIKSIAVDTDLGQRVVQISPPLDIDETGDMPRNFRSLTELLWNLLQQGGVEQAPSQSPSKAKA